MDTNNSQTPTLRLSPAQARAMDLLARGYRAEVIYNDKIEVFMESGGRPRIEKRTWKALERRGLIDRNWTNTGTCLVALIQD